MNVSVQNLGEIPEMFLPCEIPKLDIQDMGRNHIVHFFLVPVYKIISGDLFRQLVCVVNPRGMTPLPPDPPPTRVGILFCIPQGII